ncbi:MAG: hypothetical protein ACRDQV_16915 [Pseudonocardiaceae bacterium]
MAGAAGVGKTRLAREVLAIAQQRGARTRWAAATASARALPLGAFAATLGVIGPDPARLLRQASAALLTGAGRAGMIVGVDDAHLLDELSATLVHQLVLRRAASVVLTLRTGETPPDAVTALWKDGYLTRLELQPLSQDETARLVEARLDGPLDSAAGRRLWSVTQGNALYLRQLVDGELEAGRLHEFVGVWRWSGELALSPGLLSARIGQLPDALNDVLEVLAFGEPLGVPLLVTLTDAVAVEQAVEADTALAPLAELARTDAERAEATPRVAALFFTLGRPTEAEVMLDAVAGVVSEYAAVLELAAMRSVLAALLGRTVHAAEAAAAVLAQSQCSPPAAQLATWGLAAACAGLGRLDGLDERVQWIDARADSFEIGLHQAAVIAWVRGLLLAGLLDQAEHAARRYRERCQDTAGIGDMITSAMCAAVAQSRGQVKTAARWFRQSLAGHGSAFTLLFDLPGALGMGDDATSARQAFGDMAAAWNPSFVFLEPEMLLAQAWVAAAEGLTSQAVARSHHAAELARAQNQPAVEVFALHTAVCFGDRTVADRLAELATQADGPRAPAAAAHTRHQRRGSAQAATTSEHRLTPRRACRKSATSRCARRRIRDWAAPGGHDRSVMGPGAAPRGPDRPGRAGCPVVPRALPGHPRRWRVAHRHHVRGSGPVPRPGQDRGPLVPSGPRRKWQLVDAFAAHGSPRGAWDGR